jgi:hypothetical protein
MRNRNFIEDNEAARLELNQLIAHLGERSTDTAVESGWTISTSLCHLAFWDQRVLFLLKEWENSGRIDTVRLNSQSLNSINHAVKAISEAVAGPDAAQLALDAASAVDSYLQGISDALVEQLVSVGFERYLRRSLHRREHLQKMRASLERRLHDG